MVLEWVGETLGCGGSILLVVLFLLLFFSSGRRPQNFPPGLPMWPLVGSLLHMRGGPTRQTLQNLKKKYGNMASFGISSIRFVLVSGMSTLKEVFSHKHSTGRPDMVITTTRNYLLTEGRDLYVGIIGSSGERWQEQRRFVLRHLRDLGFGKTSYEPMMVDEVSELMNHIQQQKGKPLHMNKFFNRSVVNVLWGMMMGKRFSYDDAKLEKLLKTFFQPVDFNLLDPLIFIPGMTWAIMYIPILRENLTSIKDIIKFMRDELRDFMADKDLISGNSLTSVYLQEIKNRGDEQSHFNMDQMAAVVTEMFVAGMETTSSTLTMGIYLVAKHPAIQQRVQQELDSVVGNDRLPSFSDMDKLPYTQATIHEIQRTFNLVIFSLPHAALEDCTLAGYHIPKGTVLLANADDAMSDPQLWKNPNAFDPGNFLDDSGKFVKNEAFIPFGIGKRLCTGEPLARMELFIFFSCLLHRFSFTVVEEEPARIDNPTFNTTPKYTAMASLRSPL
ncbi:cytochrome P450 2D15 isoform X2 [Procambarus clarkii]|uniref:cytochrome P450 2D15 isoform X2 n=1 Tax=Procambarus clarkii TaxID=6728 RepID=UPI0037421C9B